MIQQQRQSEAVPDLVWEPETRTDTAGREILEGELHVAENRESADSQIIRLPVRRFVASGAEPLEPVLFLSGGPGQTNLDYVPPLALLEQHDVILVGFRGVDGPVVLSSPEVEGALIATGGDLLSAFSKQQFAESASACANRLTAEGIDLAGYTMTAVVDDLEETRILMDCGRVNLLSASYGTRLAQLYAARYPASLRRSLMIGVNPPGRMLWDATTTDAKLALWSQICARDHQASKRTQDLRVTMRSVIDKLPAQWNGKAVDPGKVRVMAFCMFFHVESGAIAVQSFLAAGEGDFEGLARMSESFDTVLPEMMVWGDFLAKGSTSGDFAAPVPVFNPPGTVLGSPLSELIFEAVRAWPVPPLPEEDRGVQPSTIPTLLVGGELDVSTPPEHARMQLLPSLINGHELVLENLGHVSDVLQRDPRASTSLLTKFFATGEVLNEFSAPVPNL